MKTSMRITLLVTTIAAATTFIASSAFAESHWAKNHPRRAEVNERLKMQNRRITHEEKEGEITRAQAHQLRANDRAIRGEERQMAAQNGGHITKTEQKALNQQLNQNSAAIGR